MDGIRALAVIAVLGYHLEVPHMSGGLLGVGVFFTLSGFLITGILLSAWRKAGSLNLSRFWLGRARRLLPALVVVLIVVLVATALVDRANFSTRWSETVASMFYVSNWTTIHHGVSYFDRFSPPGPLDHLWSLAVEEQFYLLWPLLLLLALAVLKWNSRRLAVATLVLTVISFGLLGYFASPGFDNTRAYEATDTRAGGLLVGAILAMVWQPFRGAVLRTPATRLAMQIGGLLGLAGIVWLIVSTNDYTMSLYRYGLLLLSVFTAALVAAVAQPGSFLGRMLGVGPLRWCGERSYGIYLWHQPVIAFAPALALANHRLLWGSLMFLVTLVLAEFSWIAVEDPIRRMGLVGALRGARARTVIIARRATVPALLTGTVSLVLAGTATLAVAGLVGNREDTLASSAMLEEGLPPLPSAETSSPVSQRAGHSESRPSLDIGGGGSVDQAGGPSSRATSCSQTVFVGDSTSIGLIDANYLPDWRDRLPAQLREVGVEDSQMDIYGARSIVERWHEQPNAQDAVHSRMDEGYDGCWTIAMGVNEAANQAVGGAYSFKERIDLVMEPIGDHPVLWLTVKTLLSDGPYSDGGMSAFNEAVLEACDRYRNLRVYDWRSEVKDTWFTSDGIHYTTSGYRARARKIAHALANAFPEDGQPASGCQVTSAPTSAR